MIGVEDLNRLAAEIVHSEVEGTEWLAAKNVSGDAIAALFDSAQRQFLAKVVEDGLDPLEAVCDIAGKTFLLGWETCEQYGVRS